MGRRRIDPPQKDMHLMVHPDTHTVVEILLQRRSKAEPKITKSQLVEEMIWHAANDMIPNDYAYPTIKVAVSRVERGREWLAQIISAAERRHRKIASERTD